MSETVQLYMSWRHQKCLVMRYVRAITIVLVAIHQTVSGWNADSVKTWARAQAPAIAVCSGAHALARWGFPLVKPYMQSCAASMITHLLPAYARADFWVSKSSPYLLYAMAFLLCCGVAQGAVRYAMPNNKRAKDCVQFGVVTGLALSCMPMSTIVAQKPWHIVVPSLYAIGVPTGVNRWLAELVIGTV